MGVSAHESRKARHVYCRIEDNKITCCYPTSNTACEALEGARSVESVGVSSAGRVLLSVLGCLGRSALDALKADVCETRVMLWRIRSRTPEGMIGGSGLSGSVCHRGVRSLPP